MFLFFWILLANALPVQLPKGANINAMDGIIQYPITFIRQPIHGSLLCKRSGCRTFFQKWTDKIIQIIKKWWNKLRRSKSKPSEATEPSSSGAASPSPADEFSKLLAEPNQKDLSDYILKYPNVWESLHDDRIRPTVASVIKVWVTEQHDIHSLNRLQDWILRRDFVNWESTKDGSFLFSKAEFVELFLKIYQSKQIIPEGTAFDIRLKLLTDYLVMHLNDLQDHPSFKNLLRITLVGADPEIVSQYLSHSQVISDPELIKTLFIQAKNHHQAHLLDSMLSKPELFNGMKQHELNELFRGIDAKKIPKELKENPRTWWGYFFGHRPKRE